jgi:hypothetical protein
MALGAPSLVFANTHRSETLIRSTAAYPAAGSFSFLVLAFARASVRASDALLLMLAYVFAIRCLLFAVCVHPE